MDIAKKITNLMSHNVTTGQMITLIDQAEDVKTRRIVNIRDKPMVIILSGPVGMGKSQIHKSTFLPTTHRHLLENDNFGSIFRTLLWYDFLNFKRHIHSLNSMTTDSIKFQTRIQDDNGMPIFVNRTLFDTSTYRILLVFEAYTCEPIAFRKKVDHLLADAKVYEILHTIRHDLKYTLHHIKFNFNLRLIWILSNSPVNFVQNLKNRVFYHTTNIDWPRFCLNQMYLFEKLIRILNVGDIIYTNYSISTDVICKHIIDTMCEAN